MKCRCGDGGGCIVMQYPPPTHTHTPSFEVFFKWVGSAGIEKVQGASTCSDSVASNHTLEKNGAKNRGNGERKIFICIFHKDLGNLWVFFKILAFLDPQFPRKRELYFASGAAILQGVHLRLEA